MAKILVSNCLLGCNCRYDGKVKANNDVCDLAAEHTLIGVCPEQMGGLPTPRMPSEIQNDGTVVNTESKNVTKQYLRGAEDTLLIAKLNCVDFAILKARSPSCGKGAVYDGSFSRKLRNGDGITAKKLMDAGIPVFSEEELDKLPLMSTDKH